MSTDSLDNRRSKLPVIVIAYLSFIVLGMPTAAFLGVAWLRIRVDFELAQDAIGLLYLTTSIAYFTASFISGRLIARFGIAPSLIISMVFEAVGFIGNATSPSWGFIVALGFIIGFGGGLLDAGMNILFAANFGPRLMNWLHACFGIGTILGPALITTIFNAGGTWRTGFVIVAGLYVVLAVVYTLTRSRWTVAGHEGGTAASPTGAAALATLRLPIVWLCIGLFLAYAGVESSASQWSPSLFVDSRGVAETLAGYWIAIYGVSFTAGRIVFGFIVDRFKTATMIRVCLAGVIAGLLLWWWNPTVELSFAGLLLFGFTLAPIFALMITSTQDRLGPHHAPNAIGFEVAAASFGAGILPGIAGVLAKNVSLEIVPPFLLVFGLIMTVFYEAIISPRITGAVTPVMAGER